MSRYAAVNVRFGADISQFSTAMQNAARQMQRAGDQLQNVGKSMSMNLTAPILALGTASLYAFGKIDMLKRGLTTFMGTTEAAEAEFSKLREVAKLPGIGLEEAVRGANNLMAIGMSADEARKAMMSFGNAIATVGGGREMFDLAIRGFGQLSNSAKPLQQDLYQIANQLPQVNKLMKEAFGTNRAEDLAAMGITGKQLADFLVTELGKLPPVTGGIANAFENMADTSKIALATFGEAIDKNFNISGKLTQFAEWVSGLADKFKNLSPEIQKASLVFAGILAAIGPIMVGLGGVIKLLPFLVSGFAALSAAAPYLAAIGVAGYLIYKNWDSVAKKIVEVTNYFIDLYNTSLIFRSYINGQIAGFKNMFTILGGVFDLMKNSLTAFGSAASSIFSYLGKVIKAVLTGDFASILDATKTLGKEMGNAWLTGAKSFFNVLTDTNNEIIGNLADGIDKTINPKIIAKVSYQTEGEKPVSNVAELMTPKGGKQTGGDVSKFDRVSIAKKEHEAFISEVEKESVKEAEVVGRSNELIGKQVERKMGFFKRIYADWVTDASATMRKATEQLGAEFSNIIQGSLAGMINDSFATIGENIAMKQDPFENIGKNLKDSMGKLLATLGSAMISWGIAQMAFNVALGTLNPVGMIAAGAAMVAIGAGVSRAAQGGLKGAATSSGGNAGSYSGGNETLTLQTRLDGNDLYLSGQRTQLVRGR